MLLTFLFVFKAFPAQIEEKKNGMPFSAIPLLRVSAICCSDYFETLFDADRPIRRATRNSTRKM